MSTTNRELTVREIVAGIQRQMREDLQPAEARDLLAMATSLIGNCNTELREAEAAYNSAFLAYLDQEVKANRAKVRADASPHWTRRQEARDVKEAVIETVRSLKTILTGINEEMRLTR